MLTHIKNWYNGKQMRIDPAEPETIGGMGVFHEYTTEFHWSAKLVRSFMAFYRFHWQWFWTTVIAAVAAYIGFLQAFSCK